MTKEDVILVVAAHPDDEILGCGGTVAKMIDNGAKAYSLILGEGKTSRGIDETTEAEQIELRKECLNANRAIGISDVYFESFTDNAFDKHALLEITKSVEKYIEQIRPNIIFTHYRNDTNIDHKITYEAVVTATRPMAGESVNCIYSFEIMSSTEWNYPLSFSPNVFVEIEDTMDKKTKALEHYASEMRDYPHPRSIKAVKKYAELWGIKTGMNEVEAFELVRERVY